MPEIYFKVAQNFYIRMIMRHIMPGDKVARAIGSAKRRDILINRESSLHAIAESLELSEVTASKQLKKLYDLGLLNARSRGRERMYSLKHPQKKDC